MNPSDETHKQMLEDAKAEAINHPAHYGGDTTYEHWKVAVAWGLNYNAFLYNCTKYICRSGGAYVGRKNGTTPLEDLQKARWYLDQAIKQAELAAQGFTTHKMVEPKREATCVDLGCDNISSPPRHSPYCRLYTGSLTQVTISHVPTE